jgi:hypothetical protein
MIELPDTPFTTEDFSLRGGGIDFLGLRWVNLTIVGRYLIPELNNVTEDMGTFFLGGWIPWKFQQICSGGEDYTEKNYKAFREKVEVALSLTLRDELGIARDCGKVRNRVGITQKNRLPGKLSFKDAKRTEQNSLYAAAIYGPSLHALGLIKAYHSQAKDGAKFLDIPISGDDDDVVEIMKGVDASLKQTSSYKLLASLDSPEFRAKDICKLGAEGLDPARYRDAAYAPLKACFRRKLLPTQPGDDPGYARTLTTRLVLATLSQRNRLSTDEIRNAWYTGMFDDGKLLRIKDHNLADHCRRWSCFMARQYQRYAIELLLWCFEDAIKQGNRSIEDIVEYWERRSKSAGVRFNVTFESFAHECAGRLLKKDEIATSQAWNEKVHGGDESFEYVEEPRDDKAVINALRMLAGWYWRMLVRQQEGKTKNLMSLGGADRMSMSWFLQWITERRKVQIHALLKDIFSSLIFAQHMRIALARFDGTAQRLRFLIGDDGIESTISARNDLGERDLPWMPDRLDTLAGLLCDCDVLAEKDGTLRLGPAANEVK